MIHQEKSHPAARYSPYRWASADFQLGLRPIKADQWILLDPDHAQTMQLKRARLMGGRAAFYRTMPCSIDAQRELRDRVLTHLVTDHPSAFRREADRLESRLESMLFDLGDQSVEPLLQLSQIIEEDFMLLQQIGDGYLITAASNAYSSSGRLVGAVGRDMPFAHVGVPGLTDKLGPRIDRMIAGVHESSPCERFNWQLTPMATKFFPTDAHQANAAAMQSICDRLRADPSLAPQLLWIRVERQTLVRLPDSKAVAFSIHTFSDALDTVRQDLPGARAMLALMASYSNERLEYSEMISIRDSVIQWLESVLATAPR